jgi:hypothetical protein
MARTTPLRTQLVPSGPHRRYRSCLRGLVRTAQPGRIWHSSTHEGRAIHRLHHRRTRRPNHPRRLQRRNVLCGERQVINCSITIDALPLTSVLGALLPRVDALIDDALNLVDDALNLNRQTVEQASSIGAPHEITVTLPVNALPDISVITVTVLSTNELAIGETPPLVPASSAAPRTSLASPMPLDRPDHRIRRANHAVVRDHSWHGHRPADRLFLRRNHQNMGRRARYGCRRVLRRDSGSHHHVQTL